MSVRTTQATGETGPAPLLTAKLAASALPEATVIRPRLFRSLDTGVTGPVTLVSGPAGWGKTTLLSSWYRTRAGQASARPAPAGQGAVGPATAGQGALTWLTVEPGDAGTRLWAYLQAALCAGTVGHEPDPGIGPVPDDPAGAGFLDRLASMVAARPEPTILVIDDVDRIDDPEVLDGLEFLLRHAGQRLRLVLGARNDPTLALHRRRLNGELTEIREADLAFTVAETAELLAAHELDLPTDQAYDLRARAEGWPAGLRFAARCLRGRTDPAQFIATFAGDHPDIADYLTEEVLAALPDGNRDVLRRIAIMEPVCGELVDALTGRADGDQLLADLSRDTGFVIELGTRPPSYRCHRMLRELLQADLRRWPTDRVRDLHHRAAAWYAGYGLPREAMQHAIAAGDREQAVGLLVAHWADLLPYRPGGRRAEAPGSSAGPEPSAGVPGDPEFALARAAYLLDRYDLPAASDWLRFATSLASGDGHPVAAMDGHPVAAMDGDTFTADRRNRFEVLAAALDLARVRVANGQPEQVRLAVSRMLDLAASTARPATSSGSPTADQPPPVELGAPVEPTAPLFELDVPPLPSAPLLVPVPLLEFGVLKPEADVPASGATAEP